MKKILLLTTLFLAGTAVNAQLTPNGNSGSSVTAYTSGAANDPIYIWCGDALSMTQGSLTATPTSGVGPFTFNWFYHNQSNASWTPYTTSSGPLNSTINGLASDGYRVEIRDVSNTVVNCFIAWVWNLNTEVVASGSRTGCSQANLSSTVNTTGSFSYYNPPPPESLINASTQIQVCFSATHTYVSDLAFYLVGPPSCGSPTILLSPNPGANGQGSICNSGDNVSNLCFTNTLSTALDVCAASVPLTGTYGNYGASNTPINWSGLLGCNAASGGWCVQIYDCIGADVGALTNSSITFSNLTSLCGSPTSITYNSGAINSVINDNSCSAGTASIFQVPPSPNLTTPITITAATTTQWTSSNAITSPGSLNTTSTGVPPGTTSFIQTATTTYANASCTSDDTTAMTYALPVVGAGTDQTACSGASVTLSGSGAVSYSWDNSVSNGVAFVPGTTTTYTVTGTDAAGCTNTDQVTVNVGTNPLVNAGADQAICPGASVTLTGTGAVSYSWNNGVSNGVSFAPASTQTYTVTGTDAAGCTNTDQVTVTVSTALNPPVNAGPDQAICPGASVTLTGSGAVSYSWNNGVSNGVSFAPASTQTYTVTGTDAAGCQNTDQVIVTLDAALNPSVNAGTDQAVCPGGSVTLTGSGAVSYSWNNGVSNGVSFAPASTQTYTVTGTDAAGCQNTDQVTVMIHSLPNVGAGPDQAVCPGGSVVLNGTGAASYSWTNGGVNGVSFVPVSTQVYTVTGTDANGCTNTDQVTVTVNPLPNVNAGADQAVCLGGYITLSGSGASSYSWNNTVTNGVPFTTTTTQIYTVTGTDANGCQNSDQVTVTINPLPVIAAGADQTICEGMAVVFSASGGTSYTWSNGVVDGTPQTLGLGTEIYTVTGTDANGCQNTDQVEVSVFPVPIAVITSSDPLEGHPGLTVGFDNGSQFGNAYSWDFGNGQTASTNYVYESVESTWSIPGSYIVTLTTSNGFCASTDQLIVVVLPYEPLILHIPNVFTPNGDGTNDFFSIDVENGTAIEVKIANRWGNHIAELNDFTAKWDGTSNGNDVDEGVYFFTYSISGRDGTTQTGHGFVELYR